MNLSYLEDTVKIETETFNRNRQHMGVNLNNLINSIKLNFL